MAASLRFIPYVGSLFTTVLLVLFSVAVFSGWTRPVLVLTLLLILELSTANVAEPLLFGHSTGVSPIALLVAAAFWTWLWGPIGLILSTPLTACLVVLGRFVPHLEFLGVLLGDEPSLDPEVTYYQRLLARDRDEATDLVEDFLQTRPKETVYDTVLVPSLVLAKRDREGGALTPDDEQFIVKVTRDIVDDLISLQYQNPPETETPLTEATRAARVKVQVFGCPASDQEDELALHMFGELLAPSGCQFEVISTKTLTGEVVARVRKDRPDVVCIAALPPGGLAQTRYLYKRLRAQFPALKIVVGRWSLSETNARLHERLVSVGADQVATTLIETRDHLIPLIQGLSHVQEAKTSA